MTRVVEIIPYLHHVGYYLSKLAINGLVLSCFRDPLSLNKSILVVGCISIYALFKKNDKGSLQNLLLLGPV